MIDSRWMREFLGKAAVLGTALCLMVWAADWARGQSPAAS